MWQQGTPTPDHSYFEGRWKVANPREGEHIYFLGGDNKFTGVWAKSRGGIFSLDRAMCMRWEGTWYCEKAEASIMLKIQLTGVTEGIFKKFGAVMFSMMNWANLSDGLVTDVEQNSFTLTLEGGKLIEKWARLT